MVQTADTVELYLAEIERSMQDAAGLGPSWLGPLRREATERFRGLGFPGRRDEEWRFTNLDPLLRVPFVTAGFDTGNVTEAALADLAHPSIESDRLVFVNGRYDAQLSDVQASPGGVFVGSLAAALSISPELIEPYLAKQASCNNHPFVALNTAFIEDGACVYLGRGKVAERPILLLFVSTASDQPTASYPRTLIVAEERSQATIIESYAGLDDCVTFTNAVTEIVAAEHAVIDHYKLNRESPQAFHVATTQIELARDAKFCSESITFGGSLTRNDINAGLRGEGIECTLNGLYLGRGRQLIDNHTSIDHAMPHCASHEIYKGILDDRARGVFNGKIFVRQDAQKTDAKQTNQTLLLSPDAQIDTKPQLEIFADDVRCTHGATVGQLDAEALFYLRSRGIGLTQARAILTYAFANDVINRISLEPLRTELEQILFHELMRS